MAQTGETRAQIDEARGYLETGGLGEVLGFTDIALSMEQPKVQMDTPMAMALCLLAGEAIIPQTIAQNLYEALQSLLKLHVAHHNTPEHAAARAALTAADGGTER